MRFRRALILAIATVTLSAPLARSQPPRASVDQTRDIMQTMRARQVLADEPELVGTNIGVTVRNRVATLWGPVASAEIAFRAELCLRTLTELAMVRNELFVSDLLEDNRPNLKNHRPPTLLPIQLPPQLPSAPLVAAPMLEIRPAGDASAPKPAVIKVQPPDSTAPSTTQPDPLTLAERDLAALVRGILQSKTTYRDVRFAVKDGHVYLRSTNADTDVLHEVARAVARLPNVNGVIVLEKMR